MAFAIIEKFAIAIIERPPALEAPTNGQIRWIFVLVVVDSGVVREDTGNDTAKWIGRLDDCGSDRKDGWRRWNAIG